MRLRARTDGNHSQIVEGLRLVGAKVQSLAAIGKGCPDLLVSYGGRNHLLEVKDPRQAPSKQRLTEDQAIWVSGWVAPVHVVHSVEEALIAIGAIRHKMTARKETP